MQGKADIKFEIRGMSFPGSGVFDCDAEVILETSSKKVEFDLGNAVVALSTFFRALDFLFEGGAEEITFSWSDTDDDQFWRWTLWHGPSEMGIEIYTGNASSWPKAQSIFRTFVDKSYFTKLVVGQGEILHKEFTEKKWGESLPANFPTDALQNLKQRVGQ